MSIKEKLSRIKEFLDKEDFSSGLEACESLIGNAGGVSSLPPPAQFPVCSSYGLCALRVGKLELAEEYCSRADAIEAPPAQIQKNLKNLADVYEGRGKWKEQAESLTRSFAFAKQNANEKRMHVLAENIAIAYLHCVEEPTCAMDYLRSYMTAEYAGGNATHTGNMMILVHKAQQALSSACSPEGKALKSSNASSVVTISQRLLDEEQQMEKDSFLFGELMATRAMEYCSRQKDGMPLEDDKMTTAIHFMATQAGLAWDCAATATWGYTPATIERFCDNVMSCVASIIDLGVVLGENLEKLNSLLSVASAVQFFSAAEEFPSPTIRTVAEKVLLTTSDSVIGNLVVGFDNLVSFKNPPSLGKHFAICHQFWQIRKSSSVASTGSRKSAWAQPPTATQVEDILGPFMQRVKGAVSSGSSFGLSIESLLQSPSSVIASLCGIFCAIYACCTPNVPLKVSRSGGSRIDAEIVLCAEARVRYAITLNTWSSNVAGGSFSYAESARHNNVFALLNVSALKATAPNEPCVLSPDGEILRQAVAQVPEVFPPEIWSDVDQNLSISDAVDALSIRGNLVMYAAVRLLVLCGYYGYSATICEKLAEIHDLGTFSALIRAEGCWSRSMAAVAAFKGTLPVSTLQENKFYEITLSLTAGLLRDTDVSDDHVLVDVLSQVDSTLSCLVVDRALLQIEIVSELYYRCGVLRWLIGGERRTNPKIKNSAMSALMTCAKVDANFGPMYSIMGHFYYLVVKDKGRATKCYLKALSIDPSDTEAGVSLCQLYLASGDIDKVVKLWDDICLLSSNAYWAHATRGRYMLCSDSYEEAAEHLQRALEKRTGYESSWFELGLCYYFQKQYLAAHRALDRARVLSSKIVHPHVYVTLGQVERHLGLYSESIEHLSSSLACFPAFCGTLDQISSENISALSGMNLRTIIACLKSLSDTYLALSHQRLTIGWTFGAAIAVEKGILCCDKAILILSKINSSSTSPYSLDQFPIISECIFKSLGDLCLCWCNLSPWDAVYLNGEPAGKGVVPPLNLVTDILKRGEWAYDQVLKSREQRNDDAETVDLASAHYDVGTSVRAQGVNFLMYYGQGSGLLPSGLFYAGIDKEDRLSVPKYWHRAKGMFSEGLRKDPLHSGCWNGLGLCLYNEQGNGESDAVLVNRKIMCFNRACQIDANPSAYANIGLLSAQRGNTVSARACFSSLQIMESNPLLWVSLGSIIDMEQFGIIDSTLKQLDLAQLSFDAFSASLEVMKPVDGLIGHAVGWIRLHDAGSLAVQSDVVTVSDCKAMSTAGVNQWSCDTLERNHYIIEVRHNVEFKTRAYLYRRPVCALGWTVLAWSLFQRCQYLEAAKAYWKAMLVLNHVSSFVNSVKTNSDSDLEHAQRVAAGLILDRAAQVGSSLKRCVHMAAAGEACSSAVNVSEKIKLSVIGGHDEALNDLATVSSKFNLPSAADVASIFCVETLTDGAVDDDKKILQLMSLHTVGDDEKACGVAKAYINDFVSSVVDALSEVGDVDDLDVIKHAAHAIPARLATTPSKCLNMLQFLLYLFKKGKRVEEISSLCAELHGLLFRAAVVLNSLREPTVNTGDTQFSGNSKGVVLKSLAVYFVISCDSTLIADFVSLFSSTNELKEQSVLILNSLLSRSKSSSLIRLVINSLSSKDVPGNVIAQQAYGFIKSTRVEENQLLNRDKRQGNFELVEPAAGVDILCGATVLSYFDTTSTSSDASVAGDEGKQPRKAIAATSKKDILSALMWDPTNTSVWATLSLSILNNKLTTDAGSSGCADADTQLCQTIVSSLSTDADNSPFNAQVRFNSSVLTSLRFVSDVSSKNSGSDDAAIFESISYARLLASSGRFQEAISAYKQMIKSTSFSVLKGQLWRELGDIYGRIFLPENSVLCYKTAFSERNDNLDNALMLLSCALSFYNRFVEQGNSEDASSCRKYIDECCTVDRQLAASLMLRSALLSKLGDKSKADAGLKKCISQWSGISLPGYYPPGV